MKANRFFILTAIICIVSLFSVDLAYGYPPISPYAYCQNNPIRYIDPDGRDVWEINQQGEIVNRIKYKTQDAFHIVQQVDGQWQRMEGQSIAFEYGTVKSSRTTTESVRDSQGNLSDRQLTIFEVNGDNNATQLFEFMASPGGQPANVEWEQVKIGSENSQRNMVGTMHSRAESGIVGYATAYGYTIRESNHNHPSGIGRPSNADIDMATMVQSLHPKATMNIYTLPRTYTPYNRYTPRPVIR